MYVAEELAEEIYQVYQSGKNGIVLEMDHRQEWEPVVQILRKRYWNGRTFLKIGYDLKEEGKSSFAPAVSQILSIPHRISDEKLGLAGVAGGSYLPIALERISRESGVGGVLVENYHLFDSTSRAQSLLELLKLLGTGGDGRILVLLTVNRKEKLPPELLPYVHCIRGRKPGIEEIQDRVTQILEKRGQKVGENFKREIVSYLQGFQCYEIEYLFARAELLYGAEAYDEEKKRLLELIGSEKVKMLERGELLEWKMVRHVDMANMERLSNYLHESGRIMGSLKEAVRNGVDVPKGILIMGLPGTGKSLFAQYAAAVLKMPLIRLEMGKMMGGHVGDSERNLREAQRQAEEMAPCILWIDEIEKGFAGTGDSAREEGAYLQRMTGGFLTWLQEKKSSCYIIATANSIEGLPPEFFRKGRFDECFYTTMPSERELRGILKVHLLKKTRSHVEPAAEEVIQETLDLATAQKRFLTGADASALVSNAFRRLYLDYLAQTEMTDKEAYDRKYLLSVMKKEFERMKVFSETNGKEIARYALASRKSSFVRASESENPSDDKKSRYDIRLEAFISEEIKKLSEEEKRI